MAKEKQKRKENTTKKGLIITAIVILSVLALIIIGSAVQVPVTGYITYMEKEPYETVEEYSAQVPYSCIETYYENEPYQVTKNTQWDVTWYTLTADRKLGASIGTSNFPATFDYN